MKKFLSFKFVLPGFLGVGILGLAAIGYWWLASPFDLWIDSAHVDAAMVHIRTSDAGTITQLLVEPGDLVEAGRVLFLQENPKVLEQQRKAQASLIELRKELQVFKNKSEQAMHDYLSDLGILPQHEVDRHLATLQEAQEKTNQTQLQLEALQEEIRLLQNQSTKLSIVSPCKAIVVQRGKNAGDQTTAGEPVVTLFDISKPWVEAEVKESHLHALEAGKKVDVYLKAYPNQKWSGEISWIGPATISKMNGVSSSGLEEKLSIKIALLDKDFPAKPGLSAEVRIKAQ